MRRARGTGEKTFWHVKTPVKQRLCHDLVSIGAALAQPKLRAAVLVRRGWMVALMG
jgi:hypothetical protein